MPKVNIYLPDDLAEAVRDAGVPVSAICQRALEQAVRRITAIRETTLGQWRQDSPADRLTSFTARARQVLDLAVEQARTAQTPQVGTGHLLGALLAEGGNLALHVLRAIDIEPATLARDLAAEAAEPSESTDDTRQFSVAAAGALELAVTEATSLGHNYVGCEHLLLGLVGEPEGTAGQLLRARGAEPRLTRRAVSAALAGYVHLRAQGAPSPAAPPADAAQLLAHAVRQEVQPLIGRLARVEQHLGLTDGG